MRFFIINKKYETIQIGKGKNLKYGCVHSYDDILELSKKYKHIIKASKKFSIVDFNGRYSVYLFTNYPIVSNIIDFLNYINKVSSNGISFINNLYIITLYNIKEKIEIL